MVTLQALREYVRLIDARNAEYGDTPQPPALDEQLQILTSQSIEVLDYKVPEGYLNLLTVTDGLDFNGYKLYASRTRPLQGYDNSVEGFIEANDSWEDYDENSDHHLIMFGETGGNLYLFDRRDQQFKVTDKVGGDAYEAFVTFEELAERLFKNALGLFDEPQQQGA